jgi:hypothetical protein
MPAARLSMRKLAALAALALLALGARSAAAQSVADQLATAKEAYAKSNVELAKNIFATIIASRQQVTPEQRVTAYKYLGAYWALQSSPGARDSANSFFLAAIDYDPFTDLDRNIFAADEQAAFARARASIFRVGVAPVEPKALDPTSTKPDSSRYTFRIVSTRGARMTVSVVSIADQNRKEILATMGNSDGVRDVVWNGLINNQRADTGLYRVQVEAVDNAKGGSTPVIEQQQFRIDHFVAQLEDTLPSFRDVNFGGTDTLRSRYSSAKPYIDGAKGAFVASLAAAIPYIVISQTQRKAMTGRDTHLGIGISLGAIAGTGAAWYATVHRDDARAARENERRRNAREAFNAGVRARNRARLDKTILIIRPLSSAGIAG